MPEGGSIVATASLAGLTSTPLDPIYSLTKHAVVGFVRRCRASDARLPGESCQFLQVDRVNVILEAGASVAIERDAARRIGLTSGPAISNFVTSPTWAAYLPSICALSIRRPPTVDCCSVAWPFAVIDAGVIGALISVTAKRASICTGHFAVELLPIGNATGIEPLKFTFCLAVQCAPIEVRVERQLRQPSSEDFGIRQGAFRVQLHRRQRRRAIA